MNSEKVIKIYIAGKVSKDSIFGKHHWRDEFCLELEKLSGIKLLSLDPVKTNTGLDDPAETFGCDCYLISKADLVVAYLSDDISIGGSQEILVAKYFKKPVIGLAPQGGKFNGSTKEYAHTKVRNYRDPFVFSTCDVVCGTINEAGEAIKKFRSIKPKSIELIDNYTQYFQTNHLEDNKYIKGLGL